MWHSYYIFRPRPHDRLLIDEVKPFIESLRPDAFFFIRYGDPSDHIRLRLKSDQHTRVLEVFPDAQMVEYVPEVERYVHMAVAERQFELSSRTVLDVMSRPDWSYDTALRSAMRMHIDLAEAFELDPHPFFRTTIRQFIRRPGVPRDRDAEARRLAEFDRRELEPASRDPRWLEGMREIAAQFDNRELQAIQAFMHMTNNRLGIRYYDEAFIARMIVRALE